MSQPVEYDNFADIYDDSLAKMLELCRARAGAAGVAGRVTLIQADFRDFALPEPAALIAVPFRTIGHLVTRADRLAGLRHIHGQLRRGGRLIFDAFVFDPEAARANAAPPLRAEYRDPTTDRDVLLWVMARLDLEARTVRIITWTDELDGGRDLVRRRYRRLSFSWLEPDDARALLLEAGFEIEAVHGDFDRRPFDSAASREQIWVARRP